MDKVEPKESAHLLARQRFFKLMKIMLAASGVVLLVAIAALKATGTPMPLHFLLAISIAVVGSLMLSAALMGLLFFSSASGADDQAPEERKP